MPAKTHLDPEKIHIADMRILHGEMDSPFSFDVEEIDSYLTTHYFNLAFRLEDNMVKADFEVNIETISNEGTNEEESKARFHLVYLFFVDNLNDLTVLRKDNTIDLQGGLGNALASIVYSTTRGILMTRFQGTALADFILPVIDPNKLLEKD